MPILKEVQENLFFYEEHSKVYTSQIVEIAGMGKFLFSSSKTEEDIVSPLNLHIWDKERGVLKFKFIYTNPRPSEGYKWILTGTMVPIPSFKLPAVIDSIDELQDNLEKLGYEGIPSEVSKAIATAILVKQKNSILTPIIDKVFSKKVDPKQKFVLDLKQTVKLTSLLQTEESLLPSERSQVFMNLFFSTKILTETELQSLRLDKNEKYFSITAEDLNNIINISEPSPSLLEKLRKVLFMPETKTLAERKEASGGESVAAHAGVGTGISFTPAQQLAQTRSDQTIQMQESDETVSKETSVEPKADTGKSQP